jgi:hypothetical protein
MKQTIICGVTLRTPFLREGRENRSLHTSYEESGLFHNSDKISLLYDAAPYELQIRLEIARIIIVRS